MDYVRVVTREVLWIWSVWIIWTFAHLVLLFFSFLLLCHLFCQSDSVACSLSTFLLGFVHPLQDVALYQCLPLSSVCCFPVPGGSLLPCRVILPSSAWSFCWSLAVYSLLFSAAYGFAIRKCFICLICSMCFYWSVSSSVCVIDRWGFFLATFV